MSILRFKDVIFVVSKKVNVKSTGVECFQTFQLDVHDTKQSIFFCENWNQETQNHDCRLSKKHNCDYKEDRKANYNQRAT